MPSSLELSGGVTNFAGSFGDYLLQIRNAIIVGMSVRHENYENYNMRTYEGMFCIPKRTTVDFSLFPKRTTVDISLILSDMGMILTKVGEDNKSLVRNKFVSDCTIEELLVAIQAKIIAA
jgi:hypothetical protein